MSTTFATEATVAEWLAAARRVVAFTGAGISTESGIPDFRSPGGVWSKYRQIDFQEFMASAAARHEYWRQKCEAQDGFEQAQPNAAHRILASWEQQGRLQAVITQNIDELHQLAGSQRVLELHGTARRVKCLDCESMYDVASLVEQFRATRLVPACPNCHDGRLKHATVSFGQSLPPDVLQEAFALAKHADLFLAIGSSLVVEPAASLPRVSAEYGARLVIVNRDPTGLDGLASAVLHQEIGVTLARIDACLTETRKQEPRGK